MFLVIFFSFAAIILFMVIRTCCFTSKQLKVKPVEFTIDDQNCLLHLAQAIKFSTISTEEPLLFKENEFLNFHLFLEKTFPNIHARLKKEIFNKYSLLYTWEGEAPSLKPILLMAHMDVVPIDPATANSWQYDPFNGDIAEGYIWGRGAMDDKSSLIAIMEAIERLLLQGFRLKRTIYLAFGHDEEIGGKNGNVVIAETLKSRGIKFQYILDEGLTITNKIVPGTNSYIAMIGIAEKGHVNIEIKVTGKGGHSSMPPKETAITILCKAIAKIVKKQHTATLQGPVRHFLRYLGPERSLLHKFILANLWLTKNIILHKFSNSSTTNALIRTTMAPTMIEGGIKENVLPHSAKAVINYRIIPGETIAMVLQKVRKTINDPRISVNALSNFRNEPIPSSKPSSQSFYLLQKTIQQIFSQTLVLPSLTIMGTDSRHYLDLTENIFQFLPIITEQSDLSRVHGIDERISTDNFWKMIAFYTQLMLNSQKEEL